MENQITLSARSPWGNRNLVKTVENAINKGIFKSISADSNREALDSVAGNESFNMGGANVFSGMTDAQASAVIRTIGSVNQESLSPSSADRSRLIREMQSVAGTEGFSLVQMPGDMEIKQAPSIALNALSHRQTAAAEAMFKTVSIPYTCEQIKYQVRSAGLGRYVYGASAYERASVLTPITAILRDSEFFLEDSLKLQPVFKGDSSASDAMFVATSDWTAWEVTYDQSDVLHRTKHKTNFLALPASIPNLLGLSQTPGQIAFDQSDEIEANSIKVENLLVRFTIGSGSTKTVVRLNTATFSNVNVGPSSQVQTSDERGLSFVARNVRAEQFMEKTGGLTGTTPTTALDSLKAGGAVPYFDLSLNVTFNRQTNSLTMNPGRVTLSQIEKDGVTYLPDTQDGTVKGLFGEFKGGELFGCHLTYNTNNLNNSNFGYRVETYNAEKQMGVRKWTPISIKYPIDKRDVNQEALNYAVEQMAVIINNEMSASSVAFGMKHFETLKRINGAPVVGNAQGSNVLAAQHFLQPSAINRETTLAELVSTKDTQDLMGNISSGITNVLSEMAAAMATNSGLAAIQEYNGVKDMEWSVIVHQNLHRFMLRQGDSRTLGVGHVADFIPCNFDSMIGKIIIIPKTKTSGDSIDPMGGIGVTLSKEDVVVEAKMTRDNKDFGLLMTQPSFQQHALNVVMGVLTLTDADKALSDEGLVHALAAQRVNMVNVGEIPSPKE